MQFSAMRLRFYYFDYFAALVFAAMRTRPMGADLFMAVGAFGKLWNT